MENPDQQSAIGRGMSDEVDILETILFGSPQGGWPETGFCIGELREKVRQLKERSAAPQPCTHTLHKEAVAKLRAGLALIAEAKAIWNRMFKQWEQG